MIKLLVALNTALVVAVMTVSVILLWKLIHGKPPTAVPIKKAKRIRMKLQISPEDAALLDKIDRYKGGI